ncbi:MAG TPA: hypothetical protein VMJ72_00275 [Candidatus Paceibacterota bacterium]|nr:hypothetical protein [Candidatus Paceibacterota bacterium]
MQWQRFVQGVVLGLVIAFAAIVIFTIGALVVLCCTHCTPAPTATVSTSAPVVAPAPPADPTLKAVQALSAEIREQRREDNGRFQVIDERLRRLEQGRRYYTPPRPTNPCDGWSEETIPPTIP